VRVLDRLPRSVLRAKGIARFAGRDWQGLFNFTCGRHELAWVKLPAVEETQAVFIGRDIERHSADIRAALAACERPESHERNANHV
jgi:hypothetical protein